MENQPQQPPTNYTELKEVLPQFPEDKQYAVYMRVKRNIRDGEWRAVPTFEWVTIPRKGGPLRVPNLLIDADFNPWIQDTLAEFSGEKKKHHPHAVSVEQLSSGQVSFDEMAKRYMDSLKPKPKARRKSKQKKATQPNT